MMIRNKSDLIFRLGNLLGRVENIEQLHIHSTTSKEGVRRDILEKLNNIKAARNADWRN